MGFSLYGLVSVPFVNSAAEASGLVEPSVASLYEFTCSRCDCFDPQIELQFCSGRPREGERFKKWYRSYRKHGLPR